MSSIKEQVSEKIEEEMSNDCLKVSILHNNLHESIVKFKEAFVSFKGIHTIDSMNIDVIVNSTTLGEITKSVGLHKMNAFLKLPEIIKSSVFYKDDAIKSHEIKFVEKVFWIKNCVMFTEDNSIWDFISLIKKQKHNGESHYVYYGTLKIRKD